MTDNTVLAYFYVDHLDVGQYKTGAFIPDNFDRVAINLPANEKYIANWSDWRVDDGLDEQDKFRPILTPAGLHYCYKLLHDACTIDPNFMTTAFQAEEYQPDTSDTIDEDEWNG